MNTKYPRSRKICGAVLLALMLAPSWCLAEPKKNPPRSIPIVMEEATVRGRVVMLETRTENRRSAEGLTIRVWSQPTVESAGSSKSERHLIAETKTDEEGMFTLPMLQVGEYIFGMGEMELRLVVVPKVEKRKGQEEPKVLLILAPREVFSEAAQNSPRTPN